MGHAKQKDVFQDLRTTQAQIRLSRINLCIIHVYQWMAYCISEYIYILHILEDTSCLVWPICEQIRLSLA